MWPLYFFYTTAAAVLILYGLNTYHLLYIYFATKGNRRAVPSAPEHWPRVTVQLPVYNEIHVVEALVRAVANLDYPRDRLDVQVLDDSTDATTALLESLVVEWKGRGATISLLHRDCRKGYKAGALAEGLASAQGELIAMFDADFIPPRNFLRRAIPHFIDGDLGMVQARWGYSNRDQSFLTRVTSLLLDGHFVIEQAALSRSRHVFNFNGTAGVWRRAAIDDAGGWSSRTLTEDRDLSYRAQLRGWKFLYLDDLVCNSELPVDIVDLRVQQSRWSKGATETALQLFMPILRSRLPLGRRLPALLHSTYALVFPALLVAVLGALPIALMYEELAATTGIVAVIVALQISVAAYPLLYAASVYESREEWPSGLIWIPPTLMLGVGLAVSNCGAVLEALFRIRTPFARTPKRAGAHVASASRQPMFVAGSDAFLAAYSLVASYVAVVNGAYIMLPLTLWYTAGFALISGLTVLRPGRRLLRRLSTS